MKTKKSFFHIIIFAIIIFISCRNQSEIQMPERGICAHRGASATHPENTMAAFKEAVRLGAHMIEFDVRQTKDGKLVVIHDSSLDELTNGTGQVADRTLAEIQALDGGSWKDSKFSEEKIPTFIEVLKLMPVNIWLNIHVKADSIDVSEIVETIISEDRLHQSVLACKEEIALAAREIDDRLLICNMDRAGSTAEYVKNTISMDANFIQLKTRADSVLSTIIPQLKQHHIKINYYGVDSKEKLQKLYDAGVDFPLINDVGQFINSCGIKPLVPKYQK